jgi:3',5'-nucleoside bisphosphate phosphatase
MKRNLFFLVFIFFTCLVYSQHTNGHYHGRTIDFPDIPGYITLVADLHTHTVFSDGEVWPTIRVQEAIRDGLDVISITDHIEYQPHENDIPHPDRNRSFVIAQNAARDQDLLVIRGAEVTRNMPPGHANAIFLEDVNKLNVDDSIKAFREAKKQGAFIFWNHPHWEAQQPDGVATLTDLHRKLIKKGMLHGIEVVNDITYSDEALQIALDHNLTIMGTSDIHGLVDWQYDVPEGGHRPVTLIFSTEKTEAAVKEALFAGRTAVFFNDLLIGKEEFIHPLLQETLQVDTATYGETWSGPDLIAVFHIMNPTDLPLILKNKSDYKLHAHADVLTIKPHTTVDIKVKTLEKLAECNMVFEVLNAVTAPGQHPEISLNVKIAEY